MIFLRINLLNFVQIKDNIIRRFATDCNLWGFGVEMMHFGAFIPEIFPDFSVPFPENLSGGLTPNRPLGYGPAGTYYNYTASPASIGRASTV